MIETDLEYVFYDYNATLDFATCYSDVKDLTKIDWELFHEIPRLDGYCKYWLSNMNNPRWVRRMETRQAEFLIHKSVPLELITMIGAYDDAKAQAVREILEEAGIELPVEVKPDWYFNNQ